MSSTLLEYGGNSEFKNSNTLDPINSFTNFESGSGIVKKESQFASRKRSLAWAQF